MRVLDIEVDLGLRASPAQLEQMVRGVRVAADVGRSAWNRQIRRAAEDRMRYPTDDELRSAVEQFPEGAESSPWYRARRQLELRERLSSEFEGMPPDFWFDHFYRHRKRSADSKLSFLMRETGLDRSFFGAAWPLQGGNVGLDAADPELYRALVAAEVAANISGEIFVREIRYRNPFGEEIAGIGKAADAVKTTAGVIETLATLGSRRRKAKAEATIAESLVPSTIEDGRLDTAIKYEQLRAAQLANELAQEELLARRLQNDQQLHALSFEARRQALVDRALAAGRLEIADAVAALTKGDAESLGELVSKEPELEEHSEPDPEEM